MLKKLLEGGEKSYCSQLSYCKPNNLGEKNTAEEKQQKKGLDAEVSEKLISVTEHRWMV